MKIRLKKKYLIKMNNKNYDYKFEDIVRSLLACNIKSGDNVYVSGNLLNFGFL